LKSVHNSKKEELWRNWPFAATTVTSVPDILQPEVVVRDNLMKLQFCGKKSDIGTKFCPRRRWPVTAAFPQIGVVTKFENVHRRKTLATVENATIILAGK